MTRLKYAVGERVEVLCYHRRGGEVVHDWLPGMVVETDERMAAVQFEADVYSNNGWPVPERILWSAHGSPRVRRGSSGENKEQGA